MSSVPCLNTPPTDFVGDTFPLDFIALAPYPIFEAGLLTGGLLCAGGTPPAYFSFAPDLAPKSSINS